jgi:hypothetical protein
MGEIKLMVKILVCLVIIINIVIKFFSRRNQSPLSKMISPIEIDLMDWIILSLWPEYFGMRY